MDEFDGIDVGGCGCLDWCKWVDCVKVKEETWLS